MIILSCINPVKILSRRKVVKINFDCLPCYVSQALEASSYAEMNEETRWKVVKSVCEELSNLDRESPSARVGQRVHKIVRDHSESGDPYREKKEISNEQASRFFDYFEEKVENSPNPLKTGAKLAAAGNIVDFGPRGDFDIETALEDSLTEQFEIDHWTYFFEMLENSSEILYFADNSGEIIYDKLFIQTLLRGSPIEKVVLVVKDGPFLNDVTLNDAKELELDRINGLELRTVDNGDNGGSPELWSSEVESWIDEYDLTISKGQANYEGLSEYDKSSLFFLLVVKCQLVERSVGAKVGSKVLINARRQRNTKV